MTAQPAPTAADGMIVSIHYTLTVDGDVVDSSSGGDPLDYLHGAGNIVPGLEAAMAGKGVGDRFEVEVEPAEGYGEVEGEAMPVPRSAFPADVEPEIGMQLFLRGPDGEPFPVWIAEVADDTVMIDPNHPLAGETLRFAVEVVGIRSATRQELEHGHPHDDGHDH